MRLAAAWQDPLEVKLFPVSQAASFIPEGSFAAATLLISLFLSRYPLRSGSFSFTYVVGAPGPRQYIYLAWAAHVGLTAKPTESRKVVTPTTIDQLHQDRVQKTFRMCKTREKRPILNFFVGFLFFQESFLLSFPNSS